jgi:VanZ family protein
MLAQMAVIFGASSIPDVKALPGGVSDKTAHFAGYALLGALAMRAISDGRWRRCTWWTGLQALWIGAVYGASDEFHQSFVPGRTPSVDDWFADTLGAAAAVLVILAIAVALGRKRGSGIR